MFSPSLTPLQQAARDFVGSGDVTENGIRRSFDTHTDYEAARHLVGRAFAGTDTAPPEPMMACVWEVLFNNNNNNNNEEQTEARVEAATFFLSFNVAEVLRKGGIAFCNNNTTTSGESGGEEEETTTTAIAVIREYDSAAEGRWITKTMDKVLFEPITFFRMLHNGGVPEEAVRNNELITPFFGRIFDLWKRTHHRLMPGKHWHLAIVATEPRCQGKGEGSRLLRRIVQQADRVGRDCFLEANSLGNARFYQKFNFVIEDTTETQHPVTGEPPITTYYMVRRYLTNKNGNNEDGDR